MNFSVFKDASKMESGFQKLHYFVSNWEEFYEQEKPTPTKDMSEEDILELGYTEQNDWFEQMSQYLNCSINAALDLTYGLERSWFKTEMIETILDMDRNPNNYEFKPILATGEFEWDETNRRFIPDV